MTNEETAKNMLALFKPDSEASVIIIEALATAIKSALDEKDKAVEKVQAESDDYADRWSELCNMLQYKVIGTPDDIPPYKTASPETVVECIKLYLTDETQSALSQVLDRKHERALLDLQVSVAELTLERNALADRVLRAEGAAHAARCGHCNCGSADVVHAFGQHETCEYYQHHCESCHALSLCTIEPCAFNPPGEKFLDDMRLLAVALREVIIPLKVLDITDGKNWGPVVREQFIKAEPLALEALHIARQRKLV